MGRQRETDELKSALEDALSGRGRLVMLVGEPGIGKTRTAQELAAHAEAQGAQVLWGRCYEGEGAPPYWPWVQALRTYIQQHDVDQLRAEMGPGSAVIAEVVPEIREKLPDLEALPSLDPEQARFRLFDSITGFLKGMSRVKPLVLVLDDLHWADRSSLLLLEFLAPEVAATSLLLLGAYRDVEVSRRHPLSLTLGNLVRQPHLLRVQLRGLSQPEVAQLVDASGDVNSVPGLVEAIHRRTEGNPLFVGEVLRELHHQGTDRPREHLNAIPEGIRDAIGRRLNRLSQDCNQVLTTASIVGREFDFRLLHKLYNQMTEEQLLDVLEEALEARIIEALPQARERYQFTHGLIQETLAEELSASRRVRLHARIAEALEGLYGDTAKAHAAELVYHFAEAEPALGPEKLVGYSLLAGERALSAYAWEEALSHFQRGLEAKGTPLRGPEPARDAEEAALLFGLSRAQAATAERHELQEAVDTTSRAFDYYQRVGDIAHAVAAAEYPQPLTALGRTSVSAFIPRALETIPPNSLQAGRLLCTYGAELGRIDSDYQGAEEAFKRALDIARQQQDSSLEVRTLAASANVDLFHLRHQEGLEKASRAMRLASRLGDHQAAWSAHLDATRILQHLGEVADAEYHAAATLEMAERLRDRHRLVLAFRISATVHRNQGKWMQAREFSDRGLAMAPRDATLLGDRVPLEHEVGDFSQGQFYMDRLLEITPAAPAPRPGAQYAVPSMAIAAVARIRGNFDYLGAAETASQMILSSPYSNPHFLADVRVVLGIIAEMRGHAASAAEHYEALLPWSGGMFLVTCSDRLLGLLSHTMGSPNQAAGHFEDALAFCRRAGYRPELAWSLCDYADTLLQNERPGDRSRARSLLEEAQAISTDLGMRPLMERISTRLEKIEAIGDNELGGVGVPQHPDGLSQREVEVLRLIATGRSNPEIAQELVISLNTVTRHVSNIFTKTGVANRAEAAAYAFRNGLVH